jgi:hypothetical protein
MDDNLKTYLNKDKYTDSFLKIVDDVIDENLEEDYIHYIFPIISNIELNREADYFIANNITLSDKQLNSDELKTISYLAPFYKEKVKYDVKQIIKYLGLLGHETSESDIEILCSNINSDYMEETISFDEYLELYYYSELKLKLINKISGNKSLNINRRVDTSNTDSTLSEISYSIDDRFIDGFDILFDTLRMR